MTAEPSEPNFADSQNAKSFNSPSVPISVYKQLATELDSAKTELTKLRSENQKLRNDIKQLQQQMQQMVQATEALNGKASPKAPEQFSQPSSSAQRSQGKSIQSKHSSTAQPRAAASHPAKRRTAKQIPVGSPTRKTLPLRMMESQRLSHTKEKSKGIDAWIIILTMLAIIVTAFATGYSLVLPLLNTNNSTSQ